MFRFALSWVNDWTEAEDLAQEAFARLWANRDWVDMEASALPWLLVVTRRLATDRVRKLRRRLLPPVRTHVPDPGVLDRWISVKSELALLPPRERAALVLVAVIGLDSDSAATALGMTPGGVRAAASRARARLSREE